MEIQYELLSDKFDELSTNASAVDLIKDMAGGTGPHHAGALKFGLREGFLRVWQTPIEPSPPPSIGSPEPPDRKKKKKKGPAVLSFS